jgi:hypothetical protein
MVKVVIGKKKQMSLKTQNKFKGGDLLAAYPMQAVMTDF